jgi:mevalonate kinase
MMIAKVRAWKKNHNKIFSKIIFEESEIIAQAIKCLEEGRHKRLGELMNTNQNFLNTIGVSSRKNEEIIIAVQNLGALGVKLVGGGRRFLCCFGGK